ncbi:MAG: type VI secretion system baseplate subunit TssG [Novosphingobium sp.]
MTAGADPLPVIDWTALAGDLRRSGLFPVVRSAEALQPQRPRVGLSKRPDQNVVDLAQQPGLGFADRTLTTLVTRGGRVQLRGYWLGLTGPMGPLPTHLTEFAHYERRYAKSQPFADFLDLLAGRMLQLFYRAWADSQPAAWADRPNDDRFAGYLAALSGAMEGVGERAAFFPRARVHYAALFAGPRSAVALQDGLGHLLGQKVRVLEYQPRWRHLEPEDRSRLGRGFATLGRDALLGDRVYSASDAFRVLVRADSLRTYRSLLPGGERFAVAAEAIEAFRPSHLEWDLTIEIADAEAPPARLDGRTELAWTGWLKPRGERPALASSRIRGDAHLRKQSTRRKGTRR